jgi:hypothetical protein
VVIFIIAAAKVTMSAAITTNDVGNGRPPYPLGNVVDLDIAIFSPRQQ